MRSLKEKSAIAIAWDFGGLIVTKGSGFIISIFLARILSPSEFGLIGMSMVFIAISQVFIDVGFNAALIQKKEVSNLEYSSVFYFNIFAGILLALLFFFSAPLIGQFYEQGEIARIVRWLSLSFIINSFVQVQTAVMIKELNFKSLTLSNMVASIAGGVIGLLAAFYSFGVYSLVIQNLVTSVISLVIIWRVSSWRPSLIFSYKSLKSLLGFSSYVFFDRLISTTFSKLDVILIGKVFSSATLGYYSRAVSLKDQVTLYSSSSLTKVFYPALSSLQDDQDKYSKVYFKVLSVISFISFALTGFLYVLGEEIILGLFGEKWVESVPMFQVLILGVSLYPINRMIVNAFMSKGGSRQNFYIGLLRKTIGLTPLYFAYAYGIHEFTVASVIVIYLLTVINIVFLNYYFKLSILEHLYRISEGAILLIVVIFAFQFVNGLSSKVILAISYLLFYYIFHRILKSEGSTFVIENIKKIMKRWKS